MASPVVEVLILIFTFALRSIQIFFEFLWNFVYTLFAALCFLLCLVTIVRAKPKETDWKGWRGDAVSRCAMLVFVDFPTLFPFLLICATVIRLPHTIRKMIEHSSFHDQAWWNFFKLVFLDIPTMLPGVIVLVSLYRIPIVLRKIKNERYRWVFHEVVWKQAFFVLCDLMFSPFALVVFLTVYRAKRMLRKVGEKQKMFDKQGACVMEFLNILVDLPSIALGLFVFCTWRLPFMVRGLKDCTRIHEARSLPWLEFGRFIYTIPVVLLLPFLLTWRGYIFYCDYKRYYNGLSANNRHLFWRDFFAQDSLEFSRELGLLALRNELMVLPDIFAALMWLFTFCTWRNPAARAIAARVARSTNWGLEGDTKFHQRSAGHFLGLFLDLFTFFLTAFVALTMSRLPQLVRSFRSAFRTNKAVSANYDIGSRQKDILFDFNTSAKHCFKYALVDVLAGLCFLFIALTLWRLPPLLSGRKKIAKAWQDKQAEYDRNHPRELDVNWKPFADTVSPLSKLGWQRLALVQFAWLLVDLTSMPAFLIVLVTLVRAPSLLGALASGGDFYKQFAILSWIEFGSLLIDIPFFLLFLVLSLARPVAAWTLLLEDRRHKRCRLLYHHMQWLPSLIKGRKSLRPRLADIESLYLKRRVQPLAMSTEYVAGPAALQTSMDETYGEIPPLDEFVPLFALSYRLFEYVAELEDHRATTEGLDPQYTYLLDAVLFQERMRARKAMRHYHTEYTYINSPDVTTREQSLQLLNGEDAAYEESVAESYAALLAYRPAMPPLWTRRTGFSSRSRKDNQNTVIEIATTGEFGNILFFLLTMVLIYRFPTVVKKLYKAFFDRSNILRGEVIEYGKDFLAVFKMLAVLLCLHHALDMLSDVGIDLFQRQSWSEARRTIGTYFADIKDDLFTLLTVVFRWKTYRTVVLAVLWGIMAPIDVFHTIVAAKIFSVPAWMAFSAVPFVIALIIAPNHRDESGYSIEAAVSVYVFVLAAALLVSVMRLSAASQVPPEIHFLRWTWLNINTVIRELFDFFQLCALLFSLQDLPLPWAGTLRTISDGLLMSWMPFERKIGAAFGLFGLWYIVASVVPLVEEVIEESARLGHISRRVSWQLAMSLLSSTLYVTIAHAFLTPFNCAPRQTLLVQDASVVCWEGSHRIFAAFGLFLLMWYTGTAVTFQLSKTHVEATRLNSSIAFAPTCTGLQTVLKMVLVCVAVVFSYNRTAVAAVFLVGCLAMALLTMNFEKLSTQAPSNSPITTVWRVAAYLAASWLGLALLVALHASGGEYLATIVWLAGWAVIALLALIASWRSWRLSDAERACKTVHDTLLTIEAELFSQGKMHSDWPQQRAVWLACVHSAKDVVCAPIQLTITEQPVWVPRPPPAPAPAPASSPLARRQLLRERPTNAALISMLNSSAPTAADAADHRPTPPAVISDNNASLGNVDFDAPPSFAASQSDSAASQQGSARAAASTQGDRFGFNESFRASPPPPPAIDTAAAIDAEDERLLEQFLRTQPWTCRCERERQPTQMRCGVCHESSPLDQLLTTRRLNQAPPLPARKQEAVPTYNSTLNTIARDVADGKALFDLYVKSLSNVLMISAGTLVNIIRDIKAKNLMQLTFELFRRRREMGSNAAFVDVSLAGRRLRNFSPYIPGSSVEEPLNNPFEEWVLSHALLTLERSVRFDAFSITYLRKRHAWTRDVLAASRDGLLELVETMREGLRGAYVPPPPELVPDFHLSPLTPDIVVDSLPPYIGPSTDPAIAARRAQTESDRALAVIEERAGAAVANLCATMLPLKSVVTFRFDEASGKFVFTLADEVKAVIKGPIDPAGLAPAKGAVFYFNDQIQGDLRDSCLNVAPGSITAGKGPISVAISSLSQRPFLDPTHFTINGKQVRVGKLQATLTTLVFEGPGYDGRQGNDVDAARPPTDMVTPQVAVESDMSTLPAYSNVPRYSVDSAQSAVTEPAAAADAVMVTIGEQASESVGVGRDMEGAGAAAAGDGADDVAPESPPKSPSPTRINVKAIRSSRPSITSLV